MEYGVAACPNCRRVVTIETRHENVTCSGCRQAFPTADRRFFYRGDDAEEARRVLQRVSAQLAGIGIEDYGTLLAQQDAERPGSMEDVVAVLQGMGEFEAQHVRDVMVRCRVKGNPERALQQLVAENRIYEPRPGRFRFV